TAHAPSNFIELADRRTLHRCSAGSSETEGLRIGCANHSTPSDAITLLRICGHLDEPRFDHHLLGRPVDGFEEKPDLIHVRLTLTVENRVRARIELRRQTALELRLEERNDGLRLGVRKSVAGSFRGFTLAFFRSLDEVDPVHLV